MTSIVEAVRDRRVVLCTGPGGVGKTTVAAALAVALARAGQRVVLITIDPARRLADALGLVELPNQPTAVALPAGNAGSLDALMLDARATFDDLVRAQAADVKQIERILSNRYYQNISGALGGTQEYMAMEKLHELVTCGRFDVVVVDTPPTKNALDFLSAPERLLRLLDNRVFKAMMPTRRGLRVVGFAAQSALRLLGRVVGSAVIDDAVGFFQAFEGMEDGFRRRAESVSTLLHGRETAWVAVTAPRDSSVAETERLLDQLRSEHVDVAGVIANRVQPTFEPLPARVPSALESALDRVRSANELATAHQAALASLRSRADVAVVQELALRPVDVRNLSMLRDLADELV